MLTLRVAAVLWKAGEITDAALCRVPLYRWPRNIALDRVFGELEEFDYISTTTPATPPPA